MHPTPAGEAFAVVKLEDRIAPSSGVIVADHLFNGSGNDAGHVSDVGNVSNVANGNHVLDQNLVTVNSNVAVNASFS